MNIQVYQLKKNFDVQKTMRFFKERRIPVQIVDLKKHQLGMRELALFVKGRKVRDLIDIALPAVKEHPIAYTTNEDVMMKYLLERPDFLITPLIRNGRETIVGYDEATLLAWVSAAT